MYVQLSGGCAVPRGTCHSQKSVRDFGASENHYDFFVILVIFLLYLCDFSVIFSSEMPLAVP